MMHALLVLPDAQIEDLDQVLSSFASDWSWTHASSADLAKEYLQGAQGFDVVVSDASIVGSEWFHELAERSPASARLALTDSSDQPVALAAAAAAHQCVERACLAEHLRAALSRTSRWRARRAAPQTFKALTRLRTVPALPRTHRELVQELQEDEPNLPLIAEILADDAAMSAKLLQLINSPYFGVREEVTDLKQAVLLLGLDLLRDLSLSHAVFQAFTGQVDEALLERLWREGHVVVAVLERLGRHLKLEDTVRADLRVAAFIHEIGRLALLAVDVNAYRACLGLEGEVLLATERDRFGTDHARAGAYLLSLWGLPERLVECVHHHHEPPRTPEGWSHAWVLGLAVLLVYEPPSRWEPSLEQQWCVLSGLEPARFAQACHDAATMVHGT